MKKPIKPLEELLDSVRDIDGFPIGKDEDILALSDPPNYTACPNPYINDFIEEYGTPYKEESDSYHGEPFIKDVSEGKNDAIYKVYSYPTKVPHKAIMRYIEHYTVEGDIVLDGFCGTGMTGLAAQILNRKIILADLSPLATYVSYHFNTPIDIDKFEKETAQVLDNTVSEYSWMYKTRHSVEKDTILHLEKSKQDRYGQINYVVWSDVFICPYCNEEYTYWNAALDYKNFLVQKNYLCPNCQATISKNECKRSHITYFDKSIQIEVTQGKQLPVLIKYNFGKSSYEKVPDDEDFKMLKKIEKLDIPFWFPTQPLPNGYNTQQPIKSHGFTHNHHFYSKRNLYIFAHLYNHLDKDNIFLLTSMLNRASKRVMTIMSNYFAQYKGKTIGGWAGKPMTGTLYIPSISTEVSVLSSIKTRYKSIRKFYLKKQPYVSKSNYIISTNSITKMGINSDSIDYIFTDPPFGQNLMYSELNYLHEGWLKVFTNNTPEAIINKVQNKDLKDYYTLMLSAFCEYYRVLKPNRWITVVFHNSKSTVWNAIQEAMTKAGFIIAQVAILDKKQGSFKQVTAAGAVKNDLVISAYKPKQSFEKQFLSRAGENLEEEFIKMHLSHLSPEPSIEHTETMLYSKLLAYYVQRSYIIKYDASTFYKMLRQNFKEEDGYWFNHDQISNYREYKRKMKLDEIDEIKTGQLLLFVSDEKSATVWLNAFLNEPKDFKAIHPAYTKISNISGDDVPDIKELLDKNFIYEDRKYRRPQTEDEKLSVTQKRERELQREFDKLLLEAKGSRKKIKECRKQAVVFGFEQCYKNNRFQNILELGRRLHKNIIENDSEISEFIEVAELKVEGF